MASLQIRNLPDDLYQALSLRATRAHRSLAQQALVELKESVSVSSSGRGTAVLAKIRADLKDKPGDRHPRPREPGTSG